MFLFHLCLEWQQADRPKYGNRLTLCIHGIYRRTIWKSFFVCHTHLVCAFVPQTSKRFIRRRITYENENINTTNTACDSVHVLQTVNFQRDKFGRVWILLWITHRNCVYVPNELGRKWMFFSSVLYFSIFRFTLVVRDSYRRTEHLVKRRCLIVAWWLNSLRFTEKDFFRLFICRR